MSYDEANLHYRDEANFWQPESLVIEWNDVHPRVRRWIDDLMRGCLDETVRRRLIVSEQLLGLSWTLEFDTRDGGSEVPAASSRLVVFVETVGPRDTRLFTYDSSYHVGHSSELSPAYRWLRRADAYTQRLPRWPLESSSPALDRSWRAVERFRLGVLDSAALRLRLVENHLAALDQADVDLVDTLALVLVEDRSGRIAQMATSRPWMIDALAVAMGDDPRMWVGADGLSHPPRLAVEGASDRRVLQAAFGSDEDCVTADRRIARLRMYARHRAATRPYSDSHVNRAHIAAAMDIECPTSWLATQSADLDKWAWAQCWAAASAMPDVARRYVARRGVDIYSEINRLSASVRSLVESGLRENAKSWLHNRIRPAVAVRWVLDRRLPCPPGVADAAVADDVTVTRVIDGKSLRLLGRHHANCLTDHAQWKLDQLDGVRVYFHCTWANESCIACVRVGETAASLEAALKAENAPLDPMDRERVVQALRVAVPSLFDSLGEIHRVLGMTRPRA